MAVLASVPGAHAQTAVERNLPPAPQAPQAEIAAPNLLPASQDDTPLGADLRAIVLLGDAQQSDASTADAGDRSCGQTGVQFCGLPELDRKPLRATLGRFIGRPISRKLIAEIQTEIARQARAINRPFVSLSTPQQEITGGVLQIRVTEFRTGQVEVKGVDARTAAAIRNRIRLQGGQQIDTAQLSEDLDWINRSPFRDTSALFAPAVTAGQTDLTIQAKPRRPYRVYAGWTNTGSQSTGRNRYYIGTILALPVLTDAYASYQITGSGDFWLRDGHVLRNQPRYVSQGGRVYIPTVPRQNLELTFSDALTNQVVNADFSVRQRTTEATLGYRSALSEMGLPVGAGDLLLAIEGKRQHRQVFFGAQSVIDQSADIWQGLIGWSKGWQEPGTQFSASLNVHGSPGGISDRSSAARLAALSNGRTTSDRYGYVDFDLSGAQRLPHGMALSASVSMQYASTALPLSAQIGLGGDGLVRGYTPDDGSFDSGIVSRTELRLPVFPVAVRSGALRDQLAPFIFLDAGYGRDRALRTKTSLASAGLGADYSIGRHFSAGLNSAWALKDGQRTNHGDWRVQARATVTF